MASRYSNNIFLVLSLILCLVGLERSAWAKEVPFTLEDRDRLIRLEAVLTEFKDSINKQFGQIDKRFEQIDRRFEQIDRRLEFMQNLSVAMLIVFGGLCGAFIGLSLWDRRTFKEKASEEAIKAVEEGKIKDILGALREIANVDNRIAEALRKFNLL